jgi:hypothetical protein
MGPKLEVLLVHPGGPYWRRKDNGAWSIPKGEMDAGEDAGDAARREFMEELGSAPVGPLQPLGEIRQRGGKPVHAFAVNGDLDCPERCKQHLRNGIAAEKRADADVSGGRTGRVVYTTDSSHDNPRGPAPPTRSAGKTCDNELKLQNDVVPGLRCGIVDPHLKHRESALQLIPRRFEYLPASRTGSSIGHRFDRETEGR